MHLLDVFHTPLTPLKRGILNGAVSKCISAYFLGTDFTDFTVARPSLIEAFGYCDYADLYGFPCNPNKPEATLLLGYGNPCNP